MSSGRKFECEICMDRYNTSTTRPHLLVPCGHTYCESCISQFEARRCPMCRANFSGHVVNWEIMNHMPDESTGLVQGRESLCSVSEFFSRGCLFFCRNNMEENVIFPNFARLSTTRKCKTFKVILF
jgi:hypothetical protein